MGRVRFIDQRAYDEMLQAFRELGPHPYKVSKALGIGSQTAVKAWEKGWPKRGLKPIKPIIEREQRVARARLIKEEQEGRKAALESSIASRTKEGKLVDLARESSRLSMSNAGKLVLATRDLVARAEKMIKDLSVSELASLGETLSVLERITKLHRVVMDTARQAMEMERLHLGEPTEMIGVITTPDEMTLAEAEKRLRSAEQAIVGARKAGGLEVIDGGLAEPVIGKRVDSA